MPRGRKRTGLRLAITDHNRDDQIRMVERCSVGVRYGVPKFAAFVNRTGRLRCAVRAYSSGKRELLEELEHACLVAALVRINPGVMAFEIAIGERRSRAMTGAGDIDHIQVIRPDQADQGDPTRVSA